MNILCFDVSSGGVSAAIFNEELLPTRAVEVDWKIPLTADQGAVLEVSAFERALTGTIRGIGAAPVDAICFATFMHNCVLLDRQERCLTPIFTWMDRRGDDGVQYLKRTFGARFHEHTGCRFHPMFPVFKLASLRLRHHPVMGSLGRVVSAKSLAISWLTGNWVEDHGTASASGLHHVRHHNWDNEVLDALKLGADVMLPLMYPNEVVGRVSHSGAKRFGLTAGTPVVVGSGDGFLANVGSGCDTPDRMAVTLGTSASARCFVPHPVLIEDAGTFCYRASADDYLLGCAGSNGGNVLDWARSVFGTLPSYPPETTDLPTFIPLLNGERAPDWNPSLTGSWFGLNARHNVQDLMHSVIDGVAFNLAHYVDILQKASQYPPKHLILSGNGFKSRSVRETLAAIVDAEVHLLRNPGLATLRGAAVCALRGLGVNPQRAVDRILSRASIVSRRNTQSASERYRRYRELRAGVG